MRPVDAVTLDEAARILGCSRSTVRRLILGGRLISHGDRYQHRTRSRADVEALAAQVYPWLRHVHEPDTYWVVGNDAAAILGVTRARLTVLANLDRVPFMR